MKTNIVVKFDIEGFHKWPGAPEVYKRLSNEHGHIFHFEVHIPVTESRQLEFLDIRQVLIQGVKQSYGLPRGKEPCDFRAMSCEDLAVSVYKTVVNMWGVGPDKVAVYEDAFVGSEVIS